MAGETQKSTALTDRDSAKVRDARLVEGKVRIAMDKHQFAAATELEAADVLIMDLPIPSNAIVQEIAIYNDDLDTDACPTLALDVGVSAREDYVSVTSSTETAHVKDDLIDADLFVDGATDGQAATTNWTVLTPDSATLGPEDALKPLHELLGYDSDPRTVFNVCVVSATASAALASAGDLAVRVMYVVD